MFKSSMIFSLRSGGGLEAAEGAVLAALAAKEAAKADLEARVVGR